MDKNIFFKNAAPKVVKVNYAGDDFYVKHLSIKETLSFESRIKTNDNNNNVTQVLIACVCDEQGNNILSDEDLESVTAIDSSLAVALYSAALKLNKMDEQEIENLKKS